jgi:hypothetical protein
MFLDLHVDCFKKKQVQKRSEVLSAPDYENRYIMSRTELLMQHHLKDNCTSQSGGPKNPKLAGLLLPCVTKEQMQEQYGYK